MTACTHDFFVAAVDETFVVSAIATTDLRVEYDVTAADRLVLVLKSVTTFPTLDYPNRVREVSFRLRFSSDLDLPQGTYRLRNDRFGEVELFLMPRPPSDGTHVLDALFN
ncbi:MAG: DUF6916 family protein [Bacteroidota bacterium]